MSNDFIWIYSCEGGAVGKQACGQGTYNANLESSSSADCLVSYMVKDIFLPFMRCAIKFEMIPCDSFIRRYDWQIEDWRQSFRIFVSVFEPNLSSCLPIVFWTNNLSVFFSSSKDYFDRCFKLLGWLCIINYHGQACKSIKGCSIMYYCQPYYFIYFIYNIIYSFMLYYNV